MNIAGIKSDSFPLSGQTIKDLSVVFRVVNAAGTGAMNILPVMTNVTIKSVLTRAGQTYEIMNDNLQNLGLLGSYFKGIEAWTATANMIQKGNGNALVALKVKLPGVLNLSAGDVLTTTCNVSPGTYGTSSTNNIGLCTVDLTWLPADGIEKMIPAIKCYTIQTNSSQQNPALGDNVYRIGVFNLDKGFGTTTPATDAQQVITQMAVNSDIMNWNELPDRMNGRIFTLFEVWSEAVYRGQSYVYIAGGRKMNNVSLNINLNTGNVNSGTNIVCWEYGIPSVETSTRAITASASNAQDAIANLQQAVGTAGVMQIAKTQAMSGSAVQGTAAQAAGVRPAPNNQAQVNAVVQHAVALSTT